MPSHKALKSVANSVVGSFTGLLNYWRDDYVMGHVVRAAWITGGTKIEFDLLTGEPRPSPLLVSAVLGSLRQLHEWFPDLVVRSGSSMDFVSSALLKVSVDPSTRRLNTSPALHGQVPPLEESPFTCSVTIVDDRGKTYRHELSDWWFPEQAGPANSTILELQAGGI